MSRTGQLSVTAVLSGTPGSVHLPSLQLPGARGGTACRVPDGWGALNRLPRLPAQLRWSGAKGNPVTLFGNSSSRGNKTDARSMRHSQHGLGRLQDAVAPAAQGSRGSSWKGPTGLSLCHGEIAVHFRPCPVQNLARRFQLTLEVTENLFLWALYAFDVVATKRIFETRNSSGHF